MGEALIERGVRQVRNAVNRVQLGPAMRFGADPDQAQPFAQPVGQGLGDLIARVGSGKGKAILRDSPGRAAMIRRVASATAARWS